MKWISDLLRKPDDTLSATQAHRQSTMPASVTAVDTDTLRKDMLATASAAERISIAGDLGQALAAQSKAPLTDDPPEVWVAATCCATDKSLALEWSSCLSSGNWLAEVASYARLAEVRIAAVMRIEDTTLLEQVAHSSRDKDKRVYRHCSDILRQRRQTARSVHRATEMAAELQTLLDHEPMPLSRLVAMKKELEAFEDGEGPLADCRQLMARALGRLHEESEARRDLQLRHAEAASLLSECARAAWPWTEHLQGWRVRLDGLTQSHTGLPAWLAAEAPAKALALTIHKTEQLLATLDAGLERVRVCEQYLATLATDTPPDAEIVAAWEALPKPEDVDARSSLQSRFLALRAIPAAAVPAPAETPRPRIDHAVVRGLLEKLEGEIDQGRLGNADTTAAQIKDALAGNSPQGALETRLQRALAQLDKLHGWARWGTGQAREHLIAAAEALLDGKHGVDDLAVAIPALREEWKRLNAHAPAANEHWKHFDATLEKAYRPVARQRAEEAARHAEARASKETMFGDWETWLTGIDWEHADYKTVEARRGEIQKIWRAAPQASFRDERQLRKRYDTLLGAIDDRLVVALATETRRREQLIAEAEALAEAKDLSQAMTQAKTLQERWSQPTAPVRLQRGDEQRLWQRFRAACNAVFARRDALRAEQTAQRQERKQARLSLLDTFEATLTAADANGIKQALTRFHSDWAAFKPATREDADGLDARAADLQRRAQQRIDESHQEKHRSRFDLLARKAALADRVQAAAIAAEPLEEIVAAAKQAWEDLPRLPGKTETLLIGRLEGAADVTPTELARGRDFRDALLLDLEIALDLPSPKSCAEARRERQLKQLQDRFGAGPARSTQAEELLIQWYATAASPDAALERRLEAVVRKLSERGAASGR